MLTTAYVVVTVVTASVNLAAAVADFARAQFVLDNAAAVHLSDRSIAPLGVLKAAGAAGLIVGLLGVPMIGLAAAVGLVLFFIGAVAFHVHYRVFGNIAYPAAFLALAVATLALDLARL
ncbi:DoxX family protein [Mycobacterium sp. IS-1556]|uniref:DoxX family protein n=1 Tax=Mycobacterium sp. IS-1556 TaxID=1772276 RepID=UPI000AD90339